MSIARTSTSHARPARPGIRRAVRALERARAVPWAGRGRGLAACLAWLLLSPALTGAQELEPRAYSPAPVGANFASVTYSHSWGALLFDPTVPITDGKAKVNGVILGYGRTFPFAGLQALALVGVPIVWGRLSGKVLGTDSSTTRSGLGDTRVKLNVNFIGAPALKPQAYARAAARSVVVGASLTLSIPTGQNDPAKLINIGTNRWAIKPEIGLSYQWRQRWCVDCYGGVWFFTANPSFYPGTSRRQQDPLGSVQGHLSYTFARRTWAALDGTWYWGGASRTNGGPASARLNNARLGALVAVGLTARQSIKLGYSFGTSTRVGQDFDTVGISYQQLWF